MPPTLGNSGEDMYLLQQRKKPKLQESLISRLPEKCLVDIFSFLPSFRDRCSCAAVCKAWLLMQASMRATDFKTTPSTLYIKNYRFSKCLEGKKASDIRLAAIAVGVNPLGGLRELSIRGRYFKTKGVTDFGLQIIAEAYPRLKSLTLWKCPNAGDRGLSAISKSCHLIEKCDLFNCPLIGDEGLISVARNCPSLLTLRVDSCPLIGNKSLQALSIYSSKLRSVSFIKCPAIGDDGIVGVLSRLSSLQRVKLVSLKVGDSAMEAVGKHASTLRSLCLENVMATTPTGFQSVESLEMPLEHLGLRSSSGLSDMSLKAIGNVFVNLRQIFIGTSLELTDDGLKKLTETARLLESIKLDDCNRVSSNGLMEIFMNCNERLKVLSLVSCNGLKAKGQFKYTKVLPKCPNLGTLTLHKCGKIEDAFLSWLCTACVYVRHFELVGLESITDGGILALLAHNRNIVSVNFRGCLQVTDRSVIAITSAIGEGLRSLRLDGCRGISDRSLQVIADLCFNLQDLELSGCEISDYGVFCLAKSKCQVVEVLSLAMCLEITDKCLSWIEILGGSLVGLNLKNCPKLSRDAIVSLRDTLWWCDFLY